jgi:hypothetical protein
MHSRAAAGVDRGRVLSGVASQEWPESVVWLLHPRLAVVPLFGDPREASKALRTSCAGRSQMQAPADQSRPGAPETPHDCDDQTGESSGPPI